jgi:predicted deacylase
LNTHDDDRGPGRGDMGFKIGERVFAPGEVGEVLFPVGSTSTYDPVVLRVRVVHGKRPGTVLAVCACIHGDEINGVEIVRRLLRSSALRNLRGTLLAIPVTNIPAYLNRSRYLPDRRDLNRLFPGSPTGSLGARLANAVLRQVACRADVAIDLHTGGINRPNLPQLRVTAGDERALELAKAFDAPVTLLAPQRESTLRALAAAEKGIPVLIYESGEALRLDAASIRFGLRGILSVMRATGMLPPRRPDAEAPKPSTVVCRRSSWERAPVGGVFTPFVPLGKAVTTETVLGFIADPFLGTETPVVATRDGIVIGRTNEAQADEGDALFHIATARDPDKAQSQISRTAGALRPIPAEDDDHPVPFDPFSEVI